MKPRRLSAYLIDLVEVVLLRNVILVIAAPFQLENRGKLNRGFVKWHEPDFEDLEYGHVEDEVVGVVGCGSACQPELAPPAATAEADIPTELTDSFMRGLMILYQR